MYKKQQSIKTKKTLCAFQQCLCTHICIHNKQAGFGLDTALAPPGGQNQILFNEKNQKNN